MMRSLRLIGFLSTVWASTAVPTAHPTPSPTPAPITLQPLPVTSFTELKAACAGSGEILVANNITFPEYITIAAGLKVVIQGSDAMVAFDGRQANRHFYVSSGASLELAKITLTAGSANGGAPNDVNDVLVNGGSVFVLQNGNFTCRSCVFRSNHAIRGGALYVAGTVTLISTNLTDQTVYAWGGVAVAATAYVVSTGALATSDCLFKDNFGPGWNYDWGSECCSSGAAVYVDGGKFTDRGSSFIDNVISLSCGVMVLRVGQQRGAAIYSTGNAQLQLSDSQFRGNVCAGCPKDCTSKNSTIYLDGSSRILATNIGLGGSDVHVGVEVEIAASATAEFLGSVPPKGLISGIYSTGDLITATTLPTTSPTTSPTPLAKTPTAKPMSPTPEPTPKPTATTATTTTITQPTATTTTTTTTTTKPTARSTPTAPPATLSSPRSMQQAASEFLVSHLSVVAYFAALVLGLGSGLGVAFLRHGPSHEFNIVPLSSVDIIFSSTIAVLQVVSNAMQVVDARRSDSDDALVCIVLVRLIMVSVTVSVVFRALYRKSLSRYVVGACFHSATVWVAIAALALLDPSILRFFCWKHGEFTKRSGGFPTMGVFYATLASSAASSLIMTVLSAAIYFHSYQGQASFAMSFVCFLHAIIAIGFRLRAEKIHKIQVLIVDGEGMIVVRDDGVFENDRRIEDDKLALEATQKELARQREEAASEKANLVNELKELREERAKMAQEIMKRSSKTNEDAAGAAVAAAAAAAEEQRAFTTNMPFADENLDVLKDQIKQFGKQPLEYIPLDLLQRELDAIVAKVNAGEKYDERRLEHLLSCLEINPQYKEEKEAERRAWKARIAPFCADCLSQQRGYTPPHIFSARFFDLCDEGLSVALAKRLMAKPCLWLIRMKQADILRLHEVELTNRYGSEGQGLDLVELAAIYACLPHEGDFPNDPSGRKAAYLSRLEDSLKCMLTAQDQHKLPQAKQRAACYSGAQPLYEHRQSLLARFITGTADTLESLRGSLSLSISISMRVSTGGGERRSENPFQKWRERDVEMQATASRGIRGPHKEAPRALSRQPGQQLACSVDEIPNPVIAVAAAGGVRDASLGEDRSQLRRDSVKEALEGAIAKRQGQARI